MTDWPAGFCAPSNAPPRPRPLKQNKKLRPAPPPTSPTHPLLPHPYNPRLPPPVPLLPPQLLIDLILHAKVDRPSNLTPFSPTCNMPPSPTKQTPPPHTHTQDSTCEQQVADLIDLILRAKLDRPSPSTQHKHPHPPSLLPPATCPPPYKTYPLQTAPVSRWLLINLILLADSPSPTTNTLPPPLLPPPPHTHTPQQTAPVSSRLLTSLTSSCGPS